MTARHAVKALLVGCALGAALASCASPSSAPVTRASAAPERRLILISFDGFRHDYIERPAARRLRELAARGVRAERLLPSFPSKTFPNHYTIVTGLTPEHHGIVANVIRDSVLGTFTLRDTLAQSESRWWGGEPIWITAELQGRRAAIVGWPGSEAPIKGRQATWWSRYNHDQPRAEKVQTMLDWLSLPASEAPALLLGYFHEVDGAGHTFGPSAPQVDSAIAQVDSALGALMDGIAARGMTDRVDIVVVSDHGMTPTSPTRAIVLDDYINLADVDVIDWNPVGALEPKPGAMDRVYAQLRGAHPALQVYKKGDVPAHFHFNAHPRITSLVLVAADGWTITSRAQVARWQRENWRGGGNHGFDPDLLTMGATFVAAGPSFAEGRVLPPVRNVHVYPLMAQVLGLRAAPSDGHADSLRAALRTRGASSP
jgi:predicted AlkP superfamily pyrophosphatase or phosphodiesterase